MSKVNGGIIIILAMITVITPSLQGTPREEPMEILWSTTTIVLTVIVIPESQGTPRKEPLKEPTPTITHVMKIK